jgi:pyruvate/2-oxoacid:ferredoxin oxidoreductase beta subunit
VADYLNLQGRFKHLTPEQRAYIQQKVDQEWARLMHQMKVGEAIEGKG